MLDVVATIGRARRDNRAGPACTVRADRSVPPSADGRAPVRDARRALGRPADHERRLGLGSAGVRGGRRRLRAPGRRHRGVHRDLEARLDGAVARLARPLLRDHRRLARAETGAEAASADRVRRASRRRARAAPRGRATASTRCSSMPTPTQAGSTGSAEVVLREGERVGRDLSGFRFYAFASGLVDRSDRAVAGGR